MSTSVNRFEGIDEKLKRSRQNIANLQVEIDAFFEEHGCAALPQDDMQLLLKAAQDLEKIVPPVRFSVLIGEIIHHLRSCLDHIVWQFSSPAYRASKNGRYIEFPILDSRPSNENRLTRYDRKIKGITNPNVLDAIERLQPYNGSCAWLHPLWRIHDMDITDKHKELVLCIPSAAITVPPEVLQESALRYQQGIITEPEWHDHLTKHVKFVPAIAFGEPGQREPETVMPLISDLHNYVAKLVAGFSLELPSLK